VDWIDWLGNLHRLKSLSEPMVGVITIGVSAVCGAIVGLERERREKPAGLRTLILICVGSAIFTLSSLLLAGNSNDPGRVASQIVTGIGFLGAGAIIHERRAVVGLTTAATIWVVAAIGIMVGIGYAVAGIVLSLLTFSILVLMRGLERWMLGKCREVNASIPFRSERGKTRQALLAILDSNQVSPSSYRFVGPTERGPERLELRYCVRHRSHRSFIADIAAIPEVEAIEEQGLRAGEHPTDED
jgi:putative Mg2+ transporter-C (MgtC) family protein